MASPLASIVLAAGQGTRMKSERAKVLHEVCGAPLVFYPIRLSVQAGARTQVVVTGHQGDLVQGVIREEFGSEVVFRTQKKQLGTGHAVMEGLKALPSFRGRILILYGDVPLLRVQTIRRMLSAMQRKKLAVAFVTARFDDPRGYGRIVRDARGQVERIVEEKDASPEEKAIQEGNAGIYCVEAEFLKRGLKKLSSRNAQGEYYLTDIVATALAQGHRVGTVEAADPEEVVGANTQKELAGLEKALRNRVVTNLMAHGVTVVDPDQTYVDPRAKIGAGTVLQPGVHIRGPCVLGKRCLIDAGAILVRARLGDDVRVNAYSIVEDAILRRNVTAGPFARVRPGTELLEASKVGNFVELKKTRLGRGAKANHLSYLGDAEIGAESNVGAGTITCNYDGHGKHKTELGAGVFIGSNATLVAPLSIRKGAYVAAGSTITDSVGAHDLAFGRARQVNKNGAAKRVRVEAQKKATSKARKKR